MAERKALRGKHKQRLLQDAPRPKKIQKTITEMLQFNADDSKMKQTTINTFFGGKPPKTICRAEQLGIKLFSEQEISEAEGHGFEKEFRQFWNLKAHELCSSSMIRMKLTTKQQIQGAIHTAWNMHKCALLEVKMEQIEHQTKQVFSDAATCAAKMKTMKKNNAQMKEVLSNIANIYDEIETKDKEGLTSDKEQVELTKNITALKKVQDAFKKSMYRRQQEIDILIAEKNLHMCSVLPAPVDDSEVEALVNDIKAGFESDNSDRNSDLEADLVDHTCINAKTCITRGKDIYEFISDTESSDDSKLSDEFPVMLPGLDKLLKK